MKQLFALLFTFVTTFAYSQTIHTSPFKRLHKPETKYTLTLAGEREVSAFRFTAPFAGFMYPQNQVVTGLGYGYNRLHWVDSTGRYYSDLSVNAVVYAGGNVTPSLMPNNIISLGLSVGLMNQLIMIGGAYNLPRQASKGSFGVVVNFSVPLN